jgi:hypothetical protein
MILGDSYEMHTYPVICITPMHVLFKWSATCSLAGVYVGRAKQGCFVHTWILCGTDVLIVRGSPLAALMVRVKPHSYYHAA